MEIRNIKNLRIIRILINNPKGDLTKYRISKLSGSSTAWVIEFLKNLEKKKLVKKTKILNFDGLIDYYIGIMPKQKYFDFYVKDPIKFLEKAKLDYALTTYAAENYIGHHLFSSRYDVYIEEEDFEKWKAMILMDGLLGKGNLRLIITKDKYLLKDIDVIKNIKMVAMPQLLIDLKKEGGVCLEAYKILVKNYV